MLTCTICDKKYSYKSELTAHTRSVHDQIASFKCDYEGCAKKYRGRGALRNHRLETHVEGRRSCAICDMTFASKAGLQRHTGKMHGQTAVFQCQYSGCEKKYQSRVFLKEHVRAKHTQARYHCRICDESFPYINSLRRHTKAHGQTSGFKCVYEGCGKVYSHQDNLWAHVKGKHIRITSHTAIHGKSRKLKSNQDPQIQSAETSAQLSKSQFKTKISYSSFVSVEQNSVGNESTRIQTKAKDNLIHIACALSREMGLKKFRNVFFTKALQACQVEGFDGDSSPTFEDIIDVNGKATLRLKNPQHVPFFRRILETIC